MGKPKLTKEARALVTKALAVIARKPDTFDMGMYMEHDEAVEGKAPYCGTVACFAGHVVLAAGFPPKDFVRASQIPRRYRPLFAAEIKRQQKIGLDGGVPVRDVAVSLLGINDAQRERLFYEDRWPKRFTRRYQKTTDIKVRADVAVERFRHWLKTGE